MTPLPDRAQTAWPDFGLGRRAISKLYHVFACYRPRLRLRRANSTYSDIPSRTSAARTGWFGYTFRLPVSFRVVCRGNYFLDTEYSVGFVQGISGKLRSIFGKDGNGCVVDKNTIAKECARDAD